MQFVCTLCTVALDSFALLYLVLLKHLSLMIVDKHIAKYSSALPLSLCHMQHAFMHVCVSLIKLLLIIFVHNRITMIITHLSLLVLG